MRWDWRVANVGLVALAAAGGYAFISPDGLAHSNVDAIACLAILLGSVTVSIAGPAYALKMYDLQVLRRPSWRRNPFPLWRDPLQFLALATWVTLAGTVGCLIRLPQTGLVGFWIILSDFSCLVGLLIGQTIAYRLFRKRIVAA
jgi:hypothetical protein